VKVIEHCSNEYYITMRNDTDLGSLEDGLNKLVDDNPGGIITDWEDTEFDAVLSGMSSAFKNPGKAIHIYIGVKHDTEESWKRIGDTIGMSLLDLQHAKKLMTKVYRAHFEFEWDDDCDPKYEDERQRALDEIERVKARGLTFIPKNSLWNEPLPGAKKIKDYHGSMIKLDRMSQLAEDTPDFLGLDWLESALLFYLAAEKDTDELLQKIEGFLLQVKED
jgi:hypothetical protein